MSDRLDKLLGGFITRLIQKKSLTREESRQAFFHVLNNEVSDMHQGAFLAALTAKGETSEEVAGAWESIYNLDTTKVAIDPSLALVENSGTGMDTFKTFNISTAASIVAAAGGVPMARHGARAITSVCGTYGMTRRHMDGLVLRGRDFPGIVGLVIHPKDLLLTFPTGDRYI